MFTHTSSGMSDIILFLYSLSIHTTLLFSSNAHSFSLLLFFYSSSLYQYLPGITLENVTCRQFDDLMSSDDRQAASHNIKLN